jgi:hypothetical protein
MRDRTGTAAWFDAALSAMLSFAVPRSPSDIRPPSRDEKSFGGSGLTTIGTAISVSSLQTTAPSKERSGRRMRRSIELPNPVTVSGKSLGFGELGRPRRCMHRDAIVAGGCRQRRLRGLGCSDAVLWPHEPVYVPLRPGEDRGRTERARKNGVTVVVHAANVGCRTALHGATQGPRIARGTSPSWVRGLKWPCRTPGALRDSPIGRPLRRIKHCVIIRRAYARRASRSGSSTPFSDQANVTARRPTSR